MFKSGQNSKQQPNEEPVKRPVIRKRSMKGLLDIDGWKCNCNPRLPAVKFTTRKQGANHGREFYKCANPDTGCDLFLWVSEARNREICTDPNQASGQLPPTPTTSTRRHTRANPNPENRVESPFKRRISPEQELRGPDLDSEPEDVEPYMNWREPAGFSNGLATPRKQRRTYTQTSPSKSNNVPLYQSRLPNVPTERGSPSKSRGASSYIPHTLSAPSVASARTPPRLQQATSVKTPSMEPQSNFISDNIFITPPTNPARRSIFDRRPTTPPPNPQLTCANPPVTPGSRNFGSPGRGLQETLISDTFKLLDRNNVNLTAFASDLRGLLVRHVRQKEGISQGRDALRQALARKELEFDELTTKIGELENKNAKLLTEKRTLENKNVELLTEKRTLLEEHRKTLEEGEKMRAEVANLSSQLERVRLSQTQHQLTQFDGGFLDKSYLNIK